MLTRRAATGLLLAPAAAGVLLAPGSALAGLLDWFNGVRLGSQLPAHDAVYLGEPPPENAVLTLLDFWATWCAPCVAALPQLDALARRFADQGLAVVGLSDEAPEHVKAWLQRRAAHQAVRYPMAAGGQQPLRATLGIKALPYALLVRPDRKVVWRGQPDALSDALLLRELEAARLSAGAARG